MVSSLFGILTIQSQIRPIVIAPIHDLDCTRAQFLAWSPFKLVGAGSGPLAIGALVIASRRADRNMLWYQVNLKAKSSNYQYAFYSILLNIYLNVNENNLHFYGVYMIFVMYFSIIRFQIKFFKHFYEIFLWNSFDVISIL